VVLVVHNYSTVYNLQHGTLRGQSSNSLHSLQTTTPTVLHWFCTAFSVST